MEVIFNFVLLMYLLQQCEYVEVPGMAASVIVALLWLGYFLAFNFRE